MADGSTRPSQADLAAASLLRSSNELTAVSFFAGCGGLDLGFRGGFRYLRQDFPLTGIEVLAAYDSDPDAVEAYRLNVGHHAHLADLAAADVRDMLTADILLGGFPCQEFSHCGPRLGLGSPRGRLYECMVRYASHHRPKLVVGENVVGLKYLNDGFALRKIERDFSAIGYNSVVWEVRAEDFGVPQARRRLILVFVREDLPHEELGSLESTFPCVTAKDAIGDLLAKGRSRVPNQDQYFRAARAGNGHGQGDERTPAHGPAYTIRANAKSRIQFHYSRPRRLTVRECARLQTFPDSFLFPFGATRNMRLIGNAVPPVLAYQVAMKIGSFLKAS